jgi:hypothetical protein
MKLKAGDVVAATIEAFRDGIRAIYKDALPDVFTDEFFLGIDEQVRREYGGTETYVQKTPKRVEANKARAVQQFARGAPLPEAARSNGISRASLYRALNQKTGGG